MPYAPSLLKPLVSKADVPKALISQFEAEAPPGPVHLMGFSLGAMAALIIAAHRAERISQVTLISAAAPLSMGNWLPDMAGAPVFRAAQRGGPGLALMTGAQSAMVSLAPGLLMRQLFAGTHPDEQAFVSQPHVRATILTGLRASYRPHRTGYQAMLRHYVTDWSAHLPHIRAPVTLRHCAADTWAPPAMAEALANALPNAQLNIRPGGGHFACLAHHGTP